MNVPRDLKATLRSIASRLTSLERRLTLGPQSLSPYSPNFDTGSWGSVAGSYYRVAQVDGLNDSNGARLILDFYGGTNFGAQQETSGTLHLVQRGTDLVFLDIFVNRNLRAAMDASQPRWFTRQISEFVFELWVLLPAYASTLNVRQGVGGVGGQAGRTQILMDSATTVAPSGLVEVAPRSRLGDTGWIAQTLASGFTGEVTARNLDDMITVRGSQIDGTHPAAGGTLATLDAEWRPAINVWGTAYMTPSAPAAAVLRANGTISVFHALTASATATQFTIVFPKG